MTLDELINRLTLVRDTLKCGGVTACIAVPGSDGFTTRLVNVCAPTAKFEKTGEEVLLIVATREG